MAAGARQITYRNGVTAVHNVNHPSRVNSYSGGRTRYYADGNTVRKTMTEPAVQPRRRPQPKQRPRYVEREELAERTTSVSINLPLTLILVFTVAVTLFIGYRYLCLKASLDSHMTAVKELESQLEDLRTENDAFEESIDTSVNLNHIYQVAVNDLGMVHAGQNNIISYDKTESEYVRQYEDIPARK